MKYSFEKTSLWQRTLGPRADDPDSEARSRLREAFLRTRANIEPLVAQIGKELPELTVHDITHLDALWDVADLLVGSTYQMSPTEAFVLGMAFLLHDAATSTFAYPKGIDSLRDTVEWRDYVAQRGWDERDLTVGSSKYKSALFEVLRLLHPKHAEKLLAQHWSDLNGQPRFLLDDVQLRNHYGTLIGRIAHSHWWDVTAVEAAWANANPQSLQSSLTVMNPSEWKVDAFKVALLLRCSDASHIDARRAPDMLSSLVQPSGISRQHWHFQNRLGLPALNTHSELYWSSGKLFTPSDADAWWLLFDTAKMVDRELRSSNRVLSTNGRSEFLAKGVAGVQYVSEFLETVPVEGWIPIDVDFKVTRIADVIEKFGGARLYGDQPWWALRELLQNAADAVRARRIKRNLPSNQGSIVVRTKSLEDGVWLEVLDNGIGMSKYVLSDVLLDFGRSLWSDDSLRRELPGLASAGFTSMGQFGIGFMSIFMLGDEVRVTSWRDGDSEKQQSTLLFSNGVRSRPVLAEPISSNKLNEFGTRVLVKLRRGRETLLPKYALHSWLSEKKQLWKLAEMVGALVPTIDIDIYADDEGTLEQVVSAHDWKTLSSVALVKRVAPRAFVEDGVKLFDVVEDDQLLGRLGTASSYQTEFGRAQCVLTHRGILVGTAKHLAGVLVASNSSDLARTTAAPVASAATLRRWAVEARSTDLTTEWISRTEMRQLISLGLAVSDIAIGDLDRNWSTPEATREWILNSELKELLLVASYVPTPEHISQKQFSEELKYFKNVIKFGHQSSDRETFGLDHWISDVFPDDQQNPRTILGAALKKLLEAFPDAKIEEGSYPIGTIFDEEIPARCTKLTLSC